jgi:hypothetical protein
MGMIRQDNHRIDAKWKTTLGSENRMAQQANVVGQQAASAVE